jgi:hypothetical protein
MLLPRRLPIACLVAALAGCATVVPAPAPGRASWALSFDRFGPVRIGMTLPEAEKALGFALTVGSPPDAPGGCFHADNAQELPGVVFMVVGDRVVRVDVVGGDHPAAGGLRIGATEEEVRARYPSSRAAPNFYDESHHDFTLRSDDGEHALLVATDGRRIDGFRAGLRGPVSWVEGCE